jgi:hypothetical protein
MDKREIDEIKYWDEICEFYEVTLQYCDFDKEMILQVQV